MRALQDLIKLEDPKLRFSQLKKSFMPYTAPIEIDGDERHALTVLLNLSLSTPECKDWLDIERAMKYFSDEKNLQTAEEEVKWYHTHNLKFPDCRVANQRILATPIPSNEVTLTSQSLLPQLGWAHNSANYKHTIWLLNNFVWRGSNENVLNLIRNQNELWSELLAEIGLSLEKQEQLRVICERSLPVSELPTEISQFSKQVRFPWQGEYLSITPVVSHAMQQQLEVLARDKHSSFRFRTLDYPNPASIGNLCGALGGHVNVLNYPIGVRKDSQRTLLVSREKSQRYFDDYQLTSKKTCLVLAHLVGFEKLDNRKAQKHVRKYQVKIIRRQIARWLLPLIELREQLETESYRHPMDIADPLVKQFLTIPEAQFKELASELNQRVHLSLQSNRFSSRFAYHPKLMRVLKIELDWVLKQLSRPESELTQTTEQTEQYIYLSSMRVFDAAARSCPYLMGAPSLTAFWGFVHRYQRDFQELLYKDDEDVSFDEFAIFIRDEVIQTTAKLTEPSVLAKKREISPVKRTTIVRDEYVDLEFDLVIKVSTSNRLSDYINQLKAALPNNFAGGALFQPDIERGASWLKTFGSTSEFLHIVKGLPGSGTWLAPHSDQPESLEALESLLPNDDTLLPVANGFHFLELPKLRDKSLTALHAFAENNIGIAKRISPIEIRLGARNTFIERCFWALESTESTILIKNKRK